MERHSFNLLAARQRRLSFASRAELCLVLILRPKTRHCSMGLYLMAIIPQRLSSAVATCPHPDHVPAARLATARLVKEKSRPKPINMSSVACKRGWHAVSTRPVWIPSNSNITNIKHSSLIHDYIHRLHTYIPLYASLLPSRPRYCPGAEPRPDHHPPSQTSD